MKKTKPLKAIVDAYRFANAWAKENGYLKKEKK